MAKGHRSQIKRARNENNRETRPSAKLSYARISVQKALFLKLFALIQRSDYIQITSIRQRDLAPDPWERDFRVRGY